MEAIESILSTSDTTHLSSLVHDKLYELENREESPCVLQQIAELKELDDKLLTIYSRLGG